MSTINKMDIKLKDIKQKKRNFKNIEISTQL